MRKVTFVLPANNVSGGARVTVEMANRLLKRGYDARIACRVTEDGMRDLLRRLWLTKIKAYKNRNWFGRFKGKIEEFQDLRAVDFSAGEVVIAVGIWTVRDVYDLDSRVIKVHYNHGFGVPEAEVTHSSWGLPMNIIAVAGTLVQRLEKVTGQKVIAVIPNGLDPGEYFVERDIRRDGVGIMYSSHPNKAPGDIIRLMPILEKEFPDIPHYIFSSHRRPRSLDTGAFVRYPSVEEARRIYNRSLIWLSTSIEEGFGLPILEAMACGCAVVSADNLGARELINDGGNGFIVPVGDLDAFQTVIRRLVSDHALRESITREGLETVTRFTWEDAVEKMDAFLKQMQA
ncbi:MAG: glycosyltransferase family 4 protein [Syntrophobacteraceae bacterium]